MDRKIDRWYNYYNHSYSSDISDSDSSDDDLIKTKQRMIDSISDNDSSGDSDYIDDYEGFKALVKMYGFDIQSKQSESETTNKIFTGCHHYRAGCDIIPPCCNKQFNCWRCHNDYYSKTESHDIDRNIKFIVCRVCNVRQKPPEKTNQRAHCIECQALFGEYYCAICQIYNSNKDCYHCKKCGICLIGDKKDFTHCDRCKCCIENTVYKTHRCLPDRMNHQCGICLDELRNGLDIKILRCGHTLHTECIEALIETSPKFTRCPQCFKTIDNITVDEIKKLDREIDESPLSDELKQMIEIGCYECGKTCVNEYHYIGTKCLHCGTYNTYKN